MPSWRVLIAPTSVVAGRGNGASVSYGYKHIHLVSKSGTSRFRPYPFDHKVGILQPVNHLGIVIDFVHPDRAAASVIVFVDLSNEVVGVNVHP